MKHQFAPVTVHAQQRILVFVQLITVALNAKPLLASVFLAQAAMYAVAMVHAQM